MGLKRAAADPSEKQTTPATDRAREKNKKNAASEYQQLFKMGFISLEEVDMEEAQTILQSAPTASKPKGRKERNKERRLMKRGTVERKPESEASDHGAEKAKEVKEEFSAVLPGWKGWLDRLHPTLIRGLATAKFPQPTAIQGKVLTASMSDGQMSGRDILGCAPTGSGKTLAYLLPILHDLLCRSSSSSAATVSGLFALIIVPTRELAIQIEKHFKQIMRAEEAVRAVTLVGGLSQEKQERLLSYSPQIIIGTPGRLAELFASNVQLQDQLGRSLEYLVLDEADRLTESGHFKDLDTILDLFTNGLSPDTIDARKKRKTFLFSATLGQPIHGLKRRLKFNDPHPLTINAAGDATTGVSRASMANPTSLKHYRLACLEEDKLMYLAALLHHAGASSVAFRALVFVNSIALVKDLALALTLMGFAAGSLHAQMVQKQRLKSLERFTGLPQAVLVTSDVAARGLDIPAVSLVVHFHVPRTLDTFLHRSGRTARANREGNSVALVAPAESALFARLATKSQVSLHEAIPGMLAYDLAESYRKAATLARRIARQETQEGRKAREKSWEERAAEELGIDLDEAPKSKHRLHDDDDGPQAVKRIKLLEMTALKAQLSRLLPARRQ